MVPEEEEEDSPVSIQDSIQKCPEQLIIGHIINNNEIREMCIFPNECFFC